MAGGLGRGAVVAMKEDGLAFGDDGLADFVAEGAGVGGLFGVAVGGRGVVEFSLGVFEGVAKVSGSDRGLLFGVLEEARWDELGFFWG